MTTTFRLNIDEMTPAFLDSLKLLFQGKEIEIVARTIDPQFEQEKEAYADALHQIETGKSYPVDKPFWDKIHASIEAV